MKKGKLLAKDGSEFTVYYHKPLPKFQTNVMVKWPDKEGLNELDVNELDVNENSAGGGMHFAFSSEGGWPPNYMGKIWKTVHEQKTMPKIMIDDSISADVVEEPVFGELYKVKGLNNIAKCEGHAIVEGVVTKRYYKMDYVGHEFYIPTDSLLKATELEISTHKGYYE